MVEADCDGIDGGIARTPTAIVMVAVLVMSGEYRAGKDEVGCVFELPAGPSTPSPVHVTHRTDAKVRKWETQLRSAAQLVAHCHSTKSMVILGLGWWRGNHQIAIAHMRPCLSRART